MSPDLQPEQRLVRSIELYFQRQQNNLPSVLQILNPVSSAFGAGFILLQIRRRINPLTNSWVMFEAFLDTYYKRPAPIDIVSCRARMVGSAVSCRRFSEHHRREHATTSSTDRRTGLNCYRDSLSL